MGPIGGGPLLSWLFVDLNSYFASVEQQARPELRGRPVGVVPMMADTTCCIAASYEAKAFGVKTGTIVADAKRMCPEIVLVEGRHELYTEYHHRIVEAVESCVPVTAVCSIDEMACRLMGRERALRAALELGIRVKQSIRERVGPMLRSSVGLATNRYLAKVASDMEKPDGLVALPLDILPEALRGLTLRDLPGIGSRTEKRLNEKGIHAMDDLLALDCEQAGEIWGSVWGERLWHWLDTVYHCREHSALATTPLLRWQRDIQQVRQLPPATDMRRLFFHRVDRLVRRDSTFLLRNRFFEAPPHLAGKRIEVRFDPLELAQVEIYCDGKPEGAARLVDAVVNGRTYR